MPPPISQFEMPVANIVMLAALATFIPGLVLVFFTHKRWPQVASATMTVLGIGLGLIGIITTVTSVQNEVFERVPASKILTSTVTLADSPISFWCLASFFGVPTLLLVVGGVISIGQSIFRVVRGISSNRHARKRLEP